MSYSKQIHRTVTLNSFTVSRQIDEEGSLRYESLQSPSTGLIIKTDGFNVLASKRLRDRAT
jgi:hypothetical protein